MHASGVDTPEDIAQCYLSNIFNVRTLPKKFLSGQKKMFLGYLSLFFTSSTKEVLTPETCGEAMLERNN